MKKSLLNNSVTLLAISVFSLLSSTINLHAYWEVSFRKVCDGSGLRQWTGTDLFDPCPSAYGNTCQISFNPIANPCGLTAQPGPNGGWILSGTMPSATFNQTNGSGSITVYNLEGKTMLSGEYEVKILNADGNNSYIGVTIDLGGVVFGTNNTFSIYVPPVN